MTILHSSSPIVRDEFVQGSTGDTWPACSFQGDLSPDRSPLRIRSRTLICFPTDRPLGESMFAIIRSNARRDQSSVRLFRRLIAFHRFTAFALFCQGNLLRRLRRIRTLRLFDRRWRRATAIDGQRLSAQKNHDEGYEEERHLRGRFRRNVGTRRRLDRAVRRMLARQESGQARRNITHCRFRPLSARQARNHQGQPFRRRFPRELA
jgi:hypothetical protein